LKEVIMRIIHLSNHMRNVGNGIVNTVVDLACKQSSQGHEVAVASSGGEFEQLLARNGVEHFYLNARESRRVLNTRACYLDIIRRFKPHIVHSHMITGVLLARLFHSNKQYAIVATVHNEFECRSLINGIADRVIAVSEAGAASLKRRGMSSHKIRTVANGTLGSVRRSCVSSAQVGSVKKPSIVTIAGLYKRKGISDLIEAFAGLPALQPAPHLYIVGDGPDATLFQAEARATKVADFIHFEGFQPCVEYYLAVADIFVLVSLREPFGLVLSEAREAGCAIVATAVDGIPQVLDGGAAGILVKPGDKGGLRTELLQLLTNEALRQQWCEKAKQNIGWLSVDRVSQEVVKVYEDLLDEKNIIHWSTH
jgi:glycosyltransferase involved in cell wall biosynthesis